jgi:hypothetical protein
MHFAIPRHALDRDDLGTFRSGCKHGAALYGASIDMHHTASTLACVAPDMSAGKTETISKHFNKKRTRLDFK